jgi:cytochrome c biogenesis protein CcdA
VATATLDVKSARRVPWPALAGLAVALVAGVAVASTFWMTDLLTAETIANWQQSVTAGQSGPAVALAMVIALGIGASMVVMPCGFPAVFAIPTILEREQQTRGRLRALAAFTLGGVVPLAVAGLVLGLAGGGLWELLSDGHSRKVFAAVTYSLLGAGAIVYALSEFGLIHVRGALERVAGPSLPGQDAPARRSFVLGATFGGGLGIACPMPTYYALLGWVVVAATAWYGALVLAAYGLGRMLVPVVLGLLIVAGASRRTVSQRLVAAHERVQWVSGVVMAALGIFLVTLFGGFLGVSLL